MNKAKDIIGHKDIRTTNLYDINLLTVTEKQDLIDKPLSADINKTKDQVGKKNKKGPNNKNN